MNMSTDPKNITPQKVRGMNRVQYGEKIAQMMMAIAKWALPGMPTFFGGLGSLTAGINKYKKPHQGKQECLRRRLDGWAWNRAKGGFGKRAYLAQDTQ